MKHLPLALGQLRLQRVLRHLGNDGGRQVGFARVVTDQATFGWVCDVFVDESARGACVGKALMAAIVAEPRLSGCRLQLATRDAAGLYEQFGFRPLRNPGRWMERLKA